ncbi:MAG: toxin co-regulated pilus biosynthesis Q family protein [Rhodobacteraceae bacterium]|jgi:hypothetical protein|nr:toxin co-regulated pilus biosynthesis Q family protein [Paracoccaceae bacterium]MBL4557358.1 toxin co-regulated pilus biosynthesis Q family protein [Paracoccaceae bacterium]
MADSFPRLNAAAPRGAAWLASLLVAALGLGVPAAVQADGPGLAGDGGAYSTGGGAVRSWGAVSGSTLRDTLLGWTGVSGWTMIWDTEYDYYLRASAQFRGTFEDAVIELVDAVHRSNPELAVTLYRGNRVIHVDTLLVETQ